MNTIDRQNIKDKQYFHMSISHNSKNRLDLDGLVNSIATNAGPENNDEPQKKTQFRMRESEVNLDVYDDYENIAEHVEENLEYYGPRDTIPAMNMSPIDQFNLNELINDKPKTLSKPAPQVKEVIKIPEDHLSLEEVGMLYSVVSEYMVDHLNLAEMYTSKHTRERNIMKPFVIEQFFK